MSGDGDSIATKGGADAPVMAPPVKRGITPQGLLTNAWYFGALSSELKPGQQFRREILGEPVLIGRTKTGTVFALRDICPHRAAPLTAGRQVEHEGEVTVECPYHGWKFGTDGVCRSIPSLITGTDYDVARMKVRAFPVSEAQGLIYVFMAQDAKAAAVPTMNAPFFPEAPGNPRLVTSRIFKSHMDHAMVGLMDPAHGPYVHQQWWWRSKGSQRDKEKAFEPRELGWAMARHAPSSNSRPYRVVFGEDVTTEIAYMLPGYRLETIQGKRGSLATLTCLTPENAGRTKITQVFWWDSLVVTLASPFMRIAAKRFLDQDGQMVDLQNEGLKYQPSLLWVDDADKQAKWYHTLKREWASSQTEQRPFANPIEPVVLKWRS
jgi:phenylpropionate dioxygenase-like ring-hydroxylating dioxygenase large terminal subunit